MGSPGLRMKVRCGVSEAIDEEHHEPADEEDGEDPLIEEEEEGAGKGHLVVGRHRGSSLGIVRATVEMSERTGTRSVAQQRAGWKRVWGGLGFPQ